MSVATDKRVRRSWLYAASLAVALLLSGCNMPNWRGGNFRDDLAQWGETQRPPGSSELMWGMSEQARQVEKNLGVQ
jgi:hypothetical protein